MSVDPSCNEHSHGNPAIGLISDSHGLPETMAAALEYLKENRCGAIYHLGDICDSLHPETADTCVGLLQDYRVKGIKGNNDHSVIVNQTGKSNKSIGPETLDYLKQLPLVIRADRVLLTHSLPFESELGLSCMIGAMDRRHALHFFRRFPAYILFRGHSHSPKIMWRDRAGRMLSENMAKGQTMDIADRIPCIVTCGALDRGFCMIWWPAENTISCRQF